MKESTFSSANLIHLPDELAGVWAEPRACAASLPIWFTCQTSWQGSCLRLCSCYVARETRSLETALARTSCSPCVLRHLSFLRAWVFRASSSDIR